MHKDSCGHTLNRLVQEIFVLSLLVLLGSPLVARDTLALSSGTSAANGGATSSVALTGGGPSAIKCTPTNPLAHPALVSASPGPTGTAAGKMLSCFGSPGACICVASTVNAGGAVLPTVPATMNSSTSSTSAVNLTNANPALTASASVRVPVAATSADIFGTALTAAHNSRSTNAGFSQPAPAPVSSQACNRVFEQPMAGLTSSQCHLLADQPS
jgi:hypothetical protein